MQAEKAVDALALAGQKRVLAEEAVEVAREDLRVQSQRYGLGVSTMLELLTSQQALVTAETNQVGARFDEEIARANLESLLGRKL